MTDPLTRISGGGFLGAGLKLGNLQIRLEGDFWNAYFVVDRAEIRIGSIRSSTVAHNKKRTDAWLALMLDIAIEGVAARSNDIRPPFSP